MWTNGQWKSAIIAAAADDEVLGIAFTVLADCSFGELGEPDAEVDVGARIVGAPSLSAVFARGAGIHETAEMELAVT